MLETGMFFSSVRLAVDTYYVYFLSKSSIILGDFASAPIEPFKALIALIALKALIALIVLLTL